MGEACPGGPRGFRHGLRAELMDGGEALPPAFVQDADEVDDVVGALDGALDRPAHAQIGLHRLDLPDIAERLEVAGEVGAAAGGADAVAAHGKGTYDVPADEARAAENDDQLWRFQNFGHGEAPAILLPAARPKAGCQAG